jgi:hypothetical protein
LAATVEEFVAEHIIEHRSTFNRWCLLIGDMGMVTGALITVLGSGHRFVGVALLLTGLGVASAGHVADRNLARALRDTWEHPMWNVRGDLAVIRGLFGRPGGGARAR